MNSFLFLSKMIVYCFWEFLFMSMSDTLLISNEILVFCVIVVCVICVARCCALVFVCLWFFEFGVICCVLFWEGSPHLWAIVWEDDLEPFWRFSGRPCMFVFFHFHSIILKTNLLRFWESSLTLHPRFPSETFYKTIHVQNICADHQSNNDNKNLEVFGNWTNDEMMFLCNKNKIFMQSENMKEKTIQKVDFSWIYWG